MSARQATPGSPATPRRVVVVGMGPGDPGLLTRLACDELGSCDLVVGAPRLLDALPQGSCARRVAACLTPDVVRAVESAPEGARVCVAVSGDVGMFSGARGLLAALEGREDVRVTCVPGVSSATLLAARLGRPWQGWAFASAHGRSCDVVALLREHPSALVVTDAAHGPAALCARLVEAGVAEGVTATVGERLSYPDERVVSMPAADAARGSFGQPSVLLLERPDAAPAGCVPAWPFASPGIPDERFERAEGVPMTKQEVRAVCLSKLRVAPDDVVFDVGAGSGSVSVEAALLARRGKVFAIERDERAARLAAGNVARFCPGNVALVRGTAPACLDGLPAPDAAFVGGSAGALAAILDALVAMSPRVRVCVTCVTLESLRDGLDALDAGPWEDVDVCQVSVARARRAGAYRLMRPLSPVYVLSARGARS